MAAGYTRERVARVTAAARYARRSELRTGAAVLALEEEPDERFALLASLFGFGRAVPRRRLGNLDVDGLARLDALGVALTGVPIAAWILAEVVIGSCGDRMQ